MGIKKTIETFIEEAKNIHGDKYVYSLVEYINTKTKVKIICQEHGIFEQTPDKHIYGNQGCKKCKNWGKTNNLNHKNDIIDRFIEKHDYKYDYSLVDYVNNKTKVKIICPTHGEFEQIPNNHLQGNGCPKCGGTKKYSNDEFIEKVREIHGDKYNYTNVVYINNKTKVKIVCSKHGEFLQSFNKHYKRKNGCSICKESKGEKEISNYLKINNVNFIPQYRFNGCVNVYTLPFDFYLPDYNTCIEFHGEQHYNPVLFFGGYEKFLKIKNNDEIKMNYCIKNKINYVCIKHDENIAKNIKKYLNI